MDCKEPDFRTSAEISFWALPKVVPGNYLLRRVLFPKSSRFMVPGSRELVRSAGK